MSDKRRPVRRRFTFGVPRDRLFYLARFMPRGFTARMERYRQAAMRNLPELDIPEPDAELPDSELSDKERAEAIARERWRRERGQRS